MAAAREHPHVRRGPHHGPLDLGEGFDSHKTRLQPAEMHHIRSEILDSLVDAVPKPARRECVLAILVFANGPLIDRAACHCKSLGPIAFRTDNVWVVGVFAFAKALGVYACLAKGMK